MTIIDNDNKLRAAIHALIDIEPIFAAIYQQTGLPPLRLRPQGFAALFNAIISQQLSVKAAQTIRDRLVAAGLDSAAAIADSADETLRAQGLSKQKIRYLRSLIAHDIDYAALTRMDDDAVIRTLTAVTGIGRWTAEIYLLFSLNRPDVCAHNDLALQSACQHAFALDTRPNEPQMRRLAQAWSPQRSAASYLLWAYYSMRKQRAALLD